MRRDATTARHHGLWLSAMLLAFASPAAGGTPVAFDPTPPPAASRTQPGAIGGSTLLAYGRIGDRSGPSVKAIVEGTAEMPLDVAASLGMNARWWPATHTAGHDEARMEYTEPYILLTRQLGTARIALSYSKEVDAGFDTRNSEQEWQATLAMPQRLSDRSLVTPALYAGDSRARQAGHTRYLGPGLTSQTNPEATWRLCILWVAICGGSRPLLQRSPAGKAPRLRQRRH